MSKRYWLREPAGVGLLVLLSVFLGVIIADAALTQHYNNTRTASYYAEKCLEESGVIIAPEAVAKCEEIAQRPQWWDAEDLEAQRQMAIWTRRIGWFTAFGLVALFLTLWETRKVTNETRRIGEAQVRAYLTVIGITIYKDYETFEFEVTVRNCGQSPASNISVVLDCEYFVRERMGHQTTDLDPISHDYITIKTQPIAAQSERPVPMRGGEIHDEVLGHLKTIYGISVEAKATVKWRDVFDKNLEQDFIFSVEDVSDYILVGKDPNTGDKVMKKIDLSPGELRMAEGYERYDDSL